MISNFYGINKFSVNRQNPCFGISREALDKLVIQHKLNIIPHRCDTSRGRVFKAYLLRENNKTAGITGMLAVRRANGKNKIILGEGKTIDEMKDNMAKSIPEKSWIVRPFYHLAEVICKV